MKLPRPSLSYGRRLEPARDWLIVLAVGGACLLASVGWNLWLFHQAANGETFGSRPASVASPFDQSKLDSLVKIFSDRASEMTKYKDGAYHFIDPSK